MTICFGFVNDNLLDVSMNFFGGFVDRLFWICQQFFDFLDDFFLDVVTWPERPKGEKDEVKEARRAAN